MLPISVGNGEVSIPHRYAKNKVSPAQLSSLSYVSIPHRYAKNNK